MRPRNEHEAYEDNALEGTVAVSLAELIVEKLKVQELLKKSWKLLDAGEESKFEKLQKVLRHPDYNDEKFIIFTEHRDTAGLSSASARRPRIHRSGCPHPRRARLSRTRAAGGVFPAIGVGRRGKLPRGDRRRG